MIAIWAPYDSITARRLGAAINEQTPALRIASKYDAVPAGAFVVNWGSKSAPPKSLNKGYLGNKLKELQLLDKGGVPIPPLMLGMPGTNEKGWLARKLWHADGDGIEVNGQHGDYYTKFIPCPREFRVHAFQGKSILLGERQPKSPKHHPFIRTTGNGWDIFYPSMRPGDDPIGMPLRQKLRSVAFAAVKAVGYDFGAVDIGQTESGSLVVFEVNSAPGLDPGAELNRYVDAIIAASKGG